MSTLKMRYDKIRNRKKQLQKAVLENGTGCTNASCFDNFIVNSKDIELDYFKEVFRIEYAKIKETLVKYKQQIDTIVVVFVIVFYLR